MLGLPISLTGPLAPFGLQVRQALELWSHHSSVPVTLKFVDDESRPSLAGSIVEQMVRDGVEVLIGPYGSATTVAAAAAAARHGRVLWNHGGASDAIGQNAIGVLTPASRYLTGVSRFLGAGRVLVRYNPRGTFAHEVLRGLNAVAREGESLALPFGEAPPANCDALVLIGRYDQEIAYLRELTARPPVVVSIAAGVRSFGTDLGHAAEGVIGPVQWFPTKDDAFSAAFRGTYGFPPDYPAASAYALGLILEALVQRTGSLLEADLRRAALSLDVETFYGRFRLDEHGRQAGHEVRLLQWREGSPELLG